MNLKRVLIFGAVFISLAAIYFFVESTGEKRKTRETPKLLFPAFKMEKAAGVIVKSREKGDFTLTRKSAVWQVENKSKTYPASAGAVEKVLDAVAEMRIETLCSKNPKNFGAFEVDKKNGIQVTVLDTSKNILADLVIGKNGPDLFSTYVRDKSSKHVILTSGMLKTDFGRDLNDWRDKKLYHFKGSSIKEYTVTDNMTLHLKKENDRWLAVKPESFEPDPDRIKELTRNFANLETASFSEDNDTKCGFDSPSKIIRAVLADNSEKILIIGKDKNAFQSFAKKSRGETTYIIEKHIIDSLCPSPESLKTAENNTDNATAAETVQ